jgi:hypothetical protein
MQEFECQGQWFLPTREMHPVAGTLRVSTSGELNLSLIGALEEGARLQVGSRYPIILGVADSPHGNQITLVDCFRTKWKSHLFSASNVREEHYAHRAFFGAHLREPADFMFRRLQVQVGGLRAWAYTLSGFSPGDLGEAGIDKRTPLLYYLMSAPVGGPVPGGEVSLGFSFASSATPAGFAFSEDPTLVVTYDAPVLEGEINQRFIYPLQNLMTFVCDRPQEVEKVSLWREDPLVPSGGRNPEIRLIEARVFPEAAGESSKMFPPYELLFTLADIEGEFAPFVRRWLDLTATYAAACNIFFGLHNSPPAFQDIVFLGLVQALGLYYTRRADGAAHRRREEGRLAEVLARLPSADADWLRGHVWDRPYPPYQDILGKLLEEHSASMNPLLRAGQPEFVAEVMNTLRYAIRRDPEAAPVASQGGELYWMNQKLRILLKLCFLRELGFSAEKMPTLVAHLPAYQHLCQLASSQRVPSGR